MFSGWVFKKSTAFSLGKLITGLTKTENSTYVPENTTKSKSMAIYCFFIMDKALHEKKLQVPISARGDGIMS